MINILKTIKRYGLNIFKGNSSIRALRFKYSNSLISDKTSIKFENIEQITFGNYIRICDYTVLSIANHSNDKLRNAHLEIGNNTYIGEFNNIRAAGGLIKIGNNCLISQHITIVSSNHKIEKDILICNQEWTSTNNFVIIEDDVWIGANSVIMPGVTICRGAVVGAGSIVTKDVPTNAIVVGNPARILRYRK